MTKEGKVYKNQPHCRLVSIINEGEDVQREWIDANSGMTGSTQVACASDVVMNVSLFRGMKKNATLDIETLRNLINQDSYSACRNPKDGKYNVSEDCGAKFCAVDENQKPKTMKLLQNAARTKKLGKRSQYCFSTEEKLKSDIVEEEVEVIVPQKNCATLGKDACIWNDDCEWEGGGCRAKSDSQLVNECGGKNVTASTCSTEKCVWDAENGCIPKTVSIAVGAGVKAAIQSMQIFR